MSNACRPQAEAETETMSAAPKELHGFELVRKQFVQEYNSQALMYRHKKTGTLHLLTSSKHIEIARRKHGMQQ